MNVCISCIIHASMCTLRVSVSQGEQICSLCSPRVPQVCSALLKPPHLPCGPCQGTLVMVGCDLPASSALQLSGLCWRSQSCDCAWAAISCGIKSWIFLKTWLWCWCFRTRLGVIRYRINLSDSCSFLLNALSIFTDLEGFVQVVLSLACSSSLFRTPLPFLIFPCSWRPLHLLPFNCRSLFHYYFQWGLMMFSAVFRSRDQAASCLILLLK